MCFKKILTAALISLALTACQDSEQKSKPAEQTQVSEAQPVVSDIDYSSMDLKLLDISEREVGASNAIVLLFNAPLQTDQDFTRFVDIQPKLATPVLSADGRKLQYTGIKPETTYNINVVAGLNAQHDSQLNDAHQETVTTRKMSPVISFKSKDGAILIPGSSEELQLYSVNVAEVDLNIYRVKADKLTRFFRQFTNISKSKAYYYSNEQRAEMVEHLYTARLQTNGPANQRHLSKFPLQDKSWANESGVYFATIGKPGAFEFEAATWFAVSSIGLQVRQFPKYTYIITQDIQTGKLLSNVQVDLLDKNSRRIASQTSNEQGVIKLAKSNKLKLIMAKKGEQVTVLPINNPRFDLSDFSVGGLKYSDTQLFAYAPRDIYRPGETAIINILHRNHDGQVRNEPLSLKIYKPDGSTFKTLWLKAMDPENGYYEYSFHLPKSSQVGNWQAVISAKGNSNYRARFHFKVEDFIPERLRLSFPDGPKLQTFTAKQGLQVSVLGEYLYGAPAAGNRLDARGKVTPWTEPFEQWKGYYLGDKENTDQVEFELKSTQLDEAGNTVSHIKQHWNRWQTPMKVRMYYSLFETGGRALNRFYDTLLWPKDSYIAVKPSFENDTSESNTKVQFNLLKLGQDGQVIAHGDTKVELIREEERYFWGYNDQNGWHYQRVAKTYVVDSRTLTFSNDDPVSLQEWVEWGNYRLELTDLASKGKTVYRFRAGSYWYNRWNSNNNMLHPDKVNLALDKASYLPGESLTLSIASPHKGTALISIETDQVLLQKQFEINELQSTVTLTLPEGLQRHDVYISAFVIAKSGQQAKSVAKRSFGIIHLPLTREQRKFAVEFDVKESWKPNQQVQVKVLVKDAQGNPISGPAKVTVSAVDSGVLSVSNYKVEDPYPFFYGQRAYLGSLTDIYDQVLEPLLAEDAKLRWGGDAALSRGGEKPESEVQIVSLFSGLVDVENGVADIPMNIPAFDGELTLTAVAFNGDQFGKQAHSIVVASPIVAQISLPKFLAIGDSSEITLDLTNVSKQALTGELKFEVAGALQAQNVTKVVNLASQQKQTLTFTINAADSLGMGSISATLLSDGESIQRDWKLPVRSTQPQDYYRHSAFLMPGESIQFSGSQLDKLLPDTRQLQLRVGVSPNLKASEHWRYLTRYPYGCLEQTTSKSRPFASVLTADGKASSMPATSVDNIKNKIQGALDRYSELQRADGSFGLWRKQSPEEHWLTAYATDFLYQLNDKGVGVPNDMLEDATNRLQSYLNSRYRHQVDRWSSSPKHYDAAYRAYSAYVLAKQAKITLGPLRDVAERDLPYAIGKLPHVHLGLAMLMTGSTTEGEALIKEGLNKERVNGYLGDYGSEVRDSAMVVNLLISNSMVPEPLRKQALLILMDLVPKIENKRWLSTQERSAILALAMTLQQQSAEKGWQGDLTIADTLQALTGKAEYYKTITLDTKESTQFVNSGDKPLYAAFDWAGIAKQANYDIEQGVKLQTEHFLINDGVATAIKDKAELATGDILLSRINVISETRISDALLVNLMPAGLELENQNLNNSLKIESLSIDGQQVKATANIIHQEYRDDRYVAALDLPKQRARTLYILSRAVNPGKYVFPAVRVESMYTPAIHGVGGNIKEIDVVKTK